MSHAADRLRLPAIFGDGLVLQQQRDVSLWGWAEPGTRITVSATWAGRPKAQTKAGSNGRWEVTLPTPAGSYQPCELTVKAGRERRTLRNVLIGEVWFASGQSNMEMPLHGFHTQPIEGGNEAIAYAGEQRGKVRFATIPKTDAPEPADSVGGRWQECSPAAARWFSALGYFFATSLRRIVDVPVGIINCSWGGTSVEGWLPDSILHAYKSLGATQPGDPSKQGWERAAVMYNGMLRPLAGYTIRGFLWNQGESNVGRHAAYPTLFKAMADHWRKLWGDDALPFYCVEIPPHDYGAADATNAALLREAQWKAVDRTPLCAMVSTSDLVEEREAADIHASKKREIGERLAFLAAAKTYGIDGISADYPRYAAMEQADSTLTLRFDHADGGFTPRLDLRGFEVCGEDRRFVSAEATLLPDFRVRLQAPGVARPVAARYCFRNFRPGRVHAMNGLPLVPFRTDSFAE